MESSASKEEDGHDTVMEDEASSKQQEENDTAVETAAAAAADAVEGEELEWSAFHDDEGRLYYYNNKSAESSWDAPADGIFTPAPPPIDDDTKEETGEASSSSSDWVVYQDEEGRDYYFHTKTEETTWEKPDNFTAPPEETGEVKEDDERMTDADKAKETKVKEDEAEMITTATESMSTPPKKETKDGSLLEKIPPVTTTTPDATVLNTPAAASKEEGADEDRPPTPPEEEPEMSPIEQARAALNQQDAILEPGVMNNLKEVVIDDSGNPKGAIQALSESYYGQTAACGLLSKWLVDLKTSSQPHQKSGDDSFSTNRRAREQSAEQVRKMTQGVVCRLSKDRFTKQGGDRILDLSRSEAVFLEDMMDSNRWRELLIDLTASNKDSALLMYCLQAISKRGHHREITRRINQSDHFAVFNAMLSSELSVIGKIAVSDCRNKDTSIHLDELVQDLVRSCTSTSYTYIFAVEMLKKLVVLSKAQQQKVNGTRSLEKAIRKWTRLGEDLRREMMDPDKTAGFKPLFRKRRLDIAGAKSELYQRQRRRSKPSGEDKDEIPLSENNISSTKRAKVEDALLTFLRRYSLGTKIDDRLLDTMLPAEPEGGPANLVGALLIKRPLAVKALLACLYKPGRDRLGSVVSKRKCAQLISLAVKEATKEAALDFPKLVISSEVENGDAEVEVTNMLVDGSQLCEAIENMVSFIVISDASTSTSLATHGEKLCVIALKCTPVSMGVAMWAQTITQASDFVSSASYATLSPSILSLLRVIYAKFPSIGEEAMTVGFSFLNHSNSEISYQKMNEIKEQSLRLLLFLAARGEAPLVLRRFKLVLSDSTNVLDASLVRYFVAGLLQMASLPFSVAFTRLLCQLLRLSVCAEAVKTSYFSEESKGRLRIVLEYLRDFSSRAGTLSSDDKSLVRDVVELYPTK